MELSRREMFWSLLGTGSVGGLAAYELSEMVVRERKTASRDDIESLLTVAGIVHPAESEAFEPVLSSYLNQLSDSRTQSILETIAELNKISRRRLGRPFHILSRNEAEQLFTILGVNRVQAAPNGTLAERIRFHLVNSVIYALMTNPNGTREFEIQNPVGYPGGIPYTE